MIVEAPPPGAGIRAGHATTPREVRPGLHPRRVLTLARAGVERCGLDLHGATVLTGAVPDAGGVTPLLAVLAGARVLVLASGDGAGEAAAAARALVRQAGLEERLGVVTDRTPDIVARADIVTGHVRPIDAATVRWMKATAVVPLMDDARRLRAADVDLEACARRSIAVAGVNEAHPTVGVLPYLGVMAVRLLADAGVAVHDSRVLLACDSPLARFLERGLRAAGAAVDVVAAPASAVATSYDAVLVALRARRQPAIGPAEAALVRERWPRAVLVHLWGDVDRSALADRDVPVWPPHPPGPDHMTLLSAALGPEPAIRLQAAGLKVGEILWRARSAGLRVEQAVGRLAVSGLGAPVPRDAGAGG